MIVWSWKRSYFFWKIASSFSILISSINFNLVSISIGIRSFNIPLEKAKKLLIDFTWLYDFLEQYILAFLKSFNPPIWSAWKWEIIICFISSVLIPIDSSCDFT